MYMKKMLYILDYMLILIHQLRQAYHTEYVRRCKAMQKYQLKAELYWRLSNKDTLHLYATKCKLNQENRHRKSTKIIFVFTIFKRMANRSRDIRLCSF